MHGEQVRFYRSKRICRAYASAHISLRWKGLLQGFPAVRYNIHLSCGKKQGLEARTVDSHACFDVPGQVKRWLRDYGNFRTG